MKRKQFTPTIYSKICSEHFLSSDILDRPGTYKKHLKSDAVPTIFPAMPSYYQPIPKKPRRTIQRIVPQEVHTVRIENHQLMSSTNDNNRVVENRVENVTSTYIENQNIKIDKSVQTEEKPLHHTVIALRRKVKVLQQKVRRQQLRISNLKDLTRSLKKKGFVDDSVENLLLDQFDGMTLELFKNQLKNSKKLSHGRRYTDEFKKFALTLHYNSPKAYNFCRYIHAFFCFPFLLFKRNRYNYIYILYMLA